MSAQYQRFLKLLEKWPLDKTKSGRDLGEHLRSQVKLLSNPISTLNPNKNKEGNSISLTEEIESLERIANNVHGNKYKRIRSSTATGLTVEQCNQVLSSEFLEYLDNDKHPAE